MHLTVYNTTRHYGGPEEGGWWYNWTNVRYSLPIHNLTEEEAELLKALLNKVHPSEGNIYSTRGGCEVDIELEEDDKVGEMATKERPRYE